MGNLKTKITSKAIAFAARPSKTPERLLFVFPDSEEVFLAAMSTMQKYMEEIPKRDEYKENPCHFFVHFPNSKFNFLENLLHNTDQKVTLVGDDALHDRRSYDLCFEFNVETAYDLSRATQKHATTAFGIQVGCEPSTFPSCPANMIEQYIDVLYLSNLPKSLVDEVTRLATESVPGIVQVRQKESEPLEDSIKQLFAAKVVIGARSLQTYYAAALNRGVVEIYPDDVHRRWLSKWSSPRYKMILGKVENVTPGLLWKGLVAQWELSPLTAQGESAQMGR